MSKMWITHIAQIATPLGRKLQKGGEMGRLHVIENGAVCMEDGVIGAVGTMEELREQQEADRGKAVFLNGTGKCLLPGFVDSHTHFIFGGYRPKEFISRLEGKQYLEILKEGGGILSTVKSTREASREELLESGSSRLRDMLEQGITTVEGKSGYGLDLKCELKQLEVMKILNSIQPVDIAATYLGAHAIPPEYGGDSDRYVEDMIKNVLPVLAEKRLADFCDVFCEEGVFTIEQSRRLLRAARLLGMESKIHADEIVALGGAELAAEIGAVSADHLLKASEEGIRAMAEKGVAATLLPCTAFCLDKPYANARKIIDSGCGAALASDLNPGSCFCSSIPLLLALAVIHMKMTVEEAVTAITLNGAAALGFAERTGSIEPGKQADLVLLKYPDYRFLVYHTGVNIVETVIKNGEVAYGNPDIKE